MPAVIDGSKCTGCGTCVDVCSEKGGAIFLNGSVAQVNEDLCMECGACVRVCPSNAIALEW
ncbi:4Fe-4S binding protein [Geoglobus acetivorans]|uniref:Ferredoxin n=1 Tax=Geoglobus acetivorans TaxID=565033 RepID=A0A0A7GEG1_GEOAI|nr:Ferredoxin [Geoglobus acetivorans]